MSNLLGEREINSLGLLFMILSHLGLLQEVVNFLSNPIKNLFLLWFVCVKKVEKISCELHCKMIKHVIL